MENVATLGLSGEELAGWDISLEFLLTKAGSSYRTFQQDSKRYITDNLVAGTILPSSTIKTPPFSHTSEEDQPHTNIPGTNDSIGPRSTRIATSG